MKWKFFWELIPHPISGSHCKWS